MAKKVRKSDAPAKRFFRSESRVFRMNEAWWFGSREGDQGPFNTEALALKELARYMDARQFDEKLAAEVGSDGLTTHVRSKAPKPTSAKPTSHDSSKRDDAVGSDWRLL